MGKPVRVQVPPTTPYKIMRLYASIILYNRSEDAEPQQNVVLFKGSSGSELRLESFAKVEDLKHNSELPLNASDQDKSRLRHHFIIRCNKLHPTIFITS